MKKLLFAVVVLLALGGLALAFRDLILFGLLAARLEPEVEFELTAAPAAPDYTNQSSWAALPGTVDASDATPDGVSAVDPAAAVVDVFFIHPTTYYSDAGWNQPLDEATANRITDEFVLRNQASAFNGCCRVYAPRYRQATLYSFMDDSGNGEAALDLAYRDVQAAFDVFLDKYNEGRPFIIAAHSQGSLHARHLLERRVAGTPLADRLVAAYPVGYGMPAAKMTETAPDVPPCAEARQTRCFVTWNSVGPEARGFEDTSDDVCVNPLSWRTDGEPAAFSANLGAWSLGGFDIMDPEARPVVGVPPLEPGAADATCVDGRLIVSEIRSTSFDARPMGRDNYHIFDYGLFYSNVRQNAIDRVNAYLAAMGQTQR